MALVEERVRVAGLRAGRCTLLVASSIAIRPLLSVVRAIIALFPFINVAIAALCWLLITPGAVRGTVATRLPIQPSKIALFREMNESISAARWLGVATCLNPLAVLRALRPLRSIELSVVALLGPFCDSISTRTVLGPFAVCSALTARLSVLELALIALLTRFYDAVATRVDGDDLCAVPGAGVARGAIQEPSRVAGLSGSIINLAITAVATELTIL